MPNRTSTGLTRTPDCCAARFIAVNRVAARTVKRPESISVRGVFQPADLPHTGFGPCAASRPQVMPQRAIRYFTHRSIMMEGLSPLHRRVAGIDVHRMLHVVTVLIE